MNRRANHRWQVEPETRPDEAQTRESQLLPHLRPISAESRPTVPPGPSRGQWFVDTCGRLFRLAAVLSAMGAIAAACFMFGRWICELTFLNHDIARVGVLTVAIVATIRILRLALGRKGL